MEPLCVAVTAALSLTLRPALKREAEPS